MLNKNVEVFMACEKEAHEADIVLFGAPFVIIFPFFILLSWIRFRNSDSMIRLSDQIFLTL